MTQLAQVGRIRLVGLLAAASMSAASVLACSRPDARIASQERWLAKGLNQPTLRLIVLEPVVRDGDSIPVMYVVRNDGPPLTFLNDPVFFTFIVLGPGGRVIEPEYLVKDNMALGSEAESTIPTGGWLGREVNLACLTLGFEPWQNSVGPGCRLKYSVTTPGGYEVVLQYRREPPPNSTAQLPVSRLILQSDTVRFEYRPPD